MAKMGCGCGNGHWGDPDAVNLVGREKHHLSMVQYLQRRNHAEQSRDQRHGTGEACSAWHGHDATVVPR